MFFFGMDVNNQKQFDFNIEREICRENACFFSNSPNLLHSLKIISI